LRTGRREGGSSGWSEVASGSLTGSLPVGVERGGVGSFLDQLALVEAGLVVEERLDRAVGDPAR